MTPSRGFTELFVWASSNGALQWRASSLTLSSPCKEDFFFQLFQLIAAFPLTYTGAEPNPSVSFKKSFSSAEAASQQIGCPCPWESLSSQTNSPPCTEWSPHLSLSLRRDFCSCTLTLWLATENTKIRQKRLKHHLGWSWKRCRSRYLHLYSRGRVRGEGSCGVVLPSHRGLTGALPRCISGNPNVTPARSPQSLFPHPQASHTALKLHNRVGERSPGWIKQEENEAFLRFTRKVNYGATYAT